MHLNPESRGLLRSLRVLSPSPFRAITVLPWQKPPTLAKSPFSIQALHDDRAGGACELVMLEAALSQEEGSGYFELGLFSAPPTPPAPWLA